MSDKFCIVLTNSSSFLIERIIAISNFACPLSTRGTFQGQEMTDEESSLQSCGLWLMASFLNHSCNSNARRSFIGDMMIVRAMKDIAPDTEVTHMYVLPTEEDRMTKFRYWDFDCKCSSCEDEKKTAKSVLAKRERTKAKVKELHELRDVTFISKVESLTKVIAATYTRPTAEVPRWELWASLLGLADMCWQNGQTGKTISAALRALESLGYVIEGGRLPKASASGSSVVVKKWGIVSDHCCASWVLLSHAYANVAPQLVEQALEYAKLSYRICVGEDESFADTVITRASPRK